MPKVPKITSIELTKFNYQVENVAFEPKYHMAVYKAGATQQSGATVIQVHTDAGISGEYVGVSATAAAQVRMVKSYLIGRSALEREPIYSDVKRALRHLDMTGLGIIDICLWDIAGKLCDLPLYMLLGGKRRPLPCYASTMHPDENGGLSTPEDMADFAEQCIGMGYPAFKMHVWGDDMKREVANVLAVRDRVGPEPDLMLDPGSQYVTFGDALKVGRACDEANYFWLEDKIVDHIQSTGGILTMEDMEAFKPRVTEPYTTTYREASVHGAILPNGGLSSLQLLNMWECFDPIPDDTVEYWHQFAELLKLVWRDRLLHLADPDHVEVPIERLLSKDYAAGRVETLRQFPDAVDKLVPPPMGDSNDGTLHVSTADAEGNVASVTISQGGAFGSLVTVPDTGIILGHGMCRLDPRPDRRNSVASLKRPLNNTIPLIIQLPDRDVAIGMPGGRRIVSVNARAALKIVDYGATSFEAVDGPRMHVQTNEPVSVTNALPDNIVNGLIEMGHKITSVNGLGGGIHCAEFLKADGTVRAGGNTPSAGSD